MLRVGVIGCGGMGRDHIKRITERIQGAEVVAVSDVFEEGAKKAAEIAGGAKVYTDGKALINDPDVDAVLVVLPGFAHVDDLLEAIKAGKRVSVRNRCVQQQTTARRLWMQKRRPADI